VKVTDWLTSDRERLLVINDLGGLAQLVRERYPQFEVASASSYLSGLASCAGGRTRGLFVGVDPTARKLHQAVAGLRKAAGASARVVLCCNPSGEPAARDALAAGADDYLVYPPSANELDSALGLPRIAADAAVEAAPTWDELNTLAGILSEIGGSRRQTLEKLCQLIAATLRTPYVCILAGEYSAYVGDPQTEPALSETIVAGGKTLGRILAGPRWRSPFTAGEVEKLRHYGRLIAHLLDAAEQQEHWQSLAMTDAVTQLPNRRYLMQALQSILARAAAERFRVTVLLFDLDGFKSFNDDYGHATGDQILRETSQLFRRHCRQHDIVARYAGDEFVVVFWDAEEPRIAGSKHPTSALAVLRRFKKSLESHEFPALGSSGKGRITISGGLATFPWDATDPAALIEKADQAMLQAKRAGRNRIFLIGAEGMAGEQMEEFEAGS
jgi:diguanylate cyclase (GGDEF)-like protein